MATVVTLVVLAVGVVLLVVVLTRPRFYSRNVGGRAEDAWGDWMRRHRLSAAEAGELEQGVLRGEEFSDPRLRAAAVDWAGTQLRAWSPGRGMRIAIGVYVVVVLAVTVGRVVAGDADRVSWSGPGLVVAFSVLALRQRRRLRRAIEVNRRVDESR